ncbi:DSD1 family PLP-dependent enzyme [Curvibacter sp. HBC61]|uniref:DSD1 family PLP-dependent enzyme n=1 Tax=Curvibacter cyanobacteriorum TaxID=3026422 RepID=A0ABT5MY35_9BURK|nr:DSD1 family PLP-dependent enzyme [Curvibacter sp. HBC61]MDD0838962.1 DSD1 family PLP-dependent enzyme [Curvibacter sp. HBC61]
MTKTIPDALWGLIGQGVDAIDTPALVIDLDAMERNLQRMVDFTAKHQILWRPHAKMHKSAELARLLMSAGAVGACVQKTSEAEALAAGGVTDLYISNQVIAPAKLARIATLAETLAGRGGWLALAVDSALGIERLAQALQGRRAKVRVLVEIDVGQGRCGVPPGEAVLPLVRQVLACPQLVFGGLQAYHGQAQHLRSPVERRAAIAQAVRAVNLSGEVLQAAGIQTPLITGAGTGTLVLETASGVYGELQAGSFLFMDADYAANERDPAQPQFEHALFVKTQVMSRSAQHAVCDAGHKSHAIDSGLPTVHTWPGEPALRFGNGGDEHGLLYPTQAGQTLPALGQTLWLIPGHCDPTVNLHDFMVGVRGGLKQGTVERIVTVDARGAVG